MEAAKETGHEERAGEGSGQEDQGVFRAQRIYKTRNGRARKSSTSQSLECIERRRILKTWGMGGGRRSRIRKTWSVGRQI